MESGKSVFSTLADHDVEKKSPSPVGKVSRQERRRKEKEQQQFKGK